MQNGDISVPKYYLVSNTCVRPIRKFEFLFHEDSLYTGV